jgi:hypothetical protein
LEVDARLHEQVVVVERGKLVALHDRLRTTTTSNASISCRAASGGQIATSKSSLS